MNQEQALKLVRQHIRLNTGMSMFVDGTSPTWGFGVGGRVLSVTIPLREVGDELLDTKLLELFTQLLGHPQAILGLWVDRLTETLHLDLSDVLDDSEAALELAKIRGERAVWDFEKGEEIWVTR